MHIWNDPNITIDTNYHLLLMRILNLVRMVPDGENLSIVDRFDDGLKAKPELAAQ